MFFGSDFDLKDADLEGAYLDYFTTIHTAFDSQGLLVGNYGSGTACSFLKEKGVVHYTWLAMSSGWGGHDDWKPQADIIQLDSTTVDGLSIDTDDVMNEAVLW